MRYTRDRRNENCGKCKKKVTLVRCWKCDGKVGNYSSCGACNSSGYTCENGRGQSFHEWWRR